MDFINESKINTRFLDSECSMKEGALFPEFNEEGKLLQILALVVKKSPRNQ